MALQEGWWKKKGKNKLIKDKPKYYILLADHLDWYSKPGGDRTGSIPLDRLYIRISNDKKELIIGDQSNSKEMVLSTDQYDSQKK